MQFFLPLCLLAAVCSLHAGAVPRAECFPVERLSPRLRHQSGELLLAALDSEALYTFVGGVKPMTANSFGPPFDWFPAADTTRVRDLQQILATWRCGEDLYADVLPSGAPPTKTRPHQTSPFLVHVPRFREIIRNRIVLFAPYGITDLTPPAAALVSIMAQLVPTPERQEDYHCYTRMRGHLFGYPEHAIEFYVRYMDARNAPAGERELKGRSVQIPTVTSSAPGATPQQQLLSFNYMVPVDAREQADDIALRKVSEAILAEYRKRRERFIGKGNPGVVELLRDWFCASNGQCSPGNATY
jgi:hypothetical protein